MSRVLGSAGLLCCLSLSALAAEAAKPVLPLFPPDAESCYGRTYDNAYLTEHDKQKVTELYLFRSLTDDPQSEGAQDSKSARAAEGIKSESDSRANAGGPEYPGFSSLQVLLRLRGNPTWYGNSVSCQPQADGGIGCSVDCDGGGFTVKKNETWLRFALGERGMLVQTSCGDDGDQSAVWVEPGVDDKLFRIDPLPIDQCLQRRDAFRPDYAQSAPPLRVRLEQNAQNCFAAGKATGVNGLSSASLQIKAYRKTTDDSNTPSFDGDLSVRRDDGKTLSKPFTCTADGYAYVCLSQPENDISFSLRRSGNDAVLLDDGKLADSSLAKWLHVSGGGRMRMSLNFYGPVCGH